MKTSHLAYSYLNYYRKSICINDMSYNIKNMPVQINITHFFRFFFRDSYVFPSVLNEAFPLLFKQSIIMNYCVIIRTPFLVPSTFQMTYIKEIKIFLLLLFFLFLGINNTFGKTFSKAKIGKVYSHKCERTNGEI